ncbi:MAG: c-type cytochrome [Nitratireductor sp.]
MAFGTMGIGAVVVAVGWAFWPSELAGVADPADAAQIARGAAVYREHCASCHGARLEGQPDWRIRKPDGRLPAPPHDESGHTWHHPDAHLFRITKHGLQPPLAPDGYESDMPAFKGVLSDAEIWATLAFIKSRWPPKTQARQPKGIPQ